MSLKSAHETSRGRGRSIAHARCRSGRAPATSRRTRSDRKIASSTEWVTKITVSPVRCPDLQQLVLQLLARHRVERAERLVHQQELGIVGEHARDRDALLHAARELVRIGVGEALQADQLENASTVSRTSRRGAPARRRPEGDVLGAR